MAARSTEFLSLVLPFSLIFFGGWFMNTKPVKSDWLPPRRVLDTR